MKNHSTAKQVPSTPVAYALDYADRGFYVFPVQKHKKIPFWNFSWTTLSTNNHGEIKQMAKQYPDCNWAMDCGKSNIFVLDIDRHARKDGLEALKALEIPEASFTVRTPSGGYHYYYAGQGANSASKLAPGLDTRGAGGYVLIPGSMNSQKQTYTLLRDRPLEPAPPMVTEPLKAKLPKPKKSFESYLDIDTETNIKLATDYLTKTAPEAIENQGGDQTTYQVACRLRDFGVSPDRALSLMMEKWNETKAHPPWSISALETKIKNAYRYAKNTPGNATPDMLFPSSERSTPDIYCAADINISDLKPREWILDTRYIKQNLTVTVAPGGTGKSSLVLLECLSVASGKDLTYSKVRIPGAVWYYNTEDPMDEIKLRVAAAAKYYGLTRADLKDFYISSGRTNPLVLVADDKRQGLVINKGGIDWLIKGIRERKAVLLALDPFVRCHSVSENDNMAIDKVVQQLQRVADATGCAISVVHHTSKGDKHTHGNAEKSRGASALVNSSRITHTFYNMSEGESSDYGIPAKDHNWYVRLTNAKNNLSPPDIIAKWFKKQSVKIFLGSDETIGTLEKVDLDPITEESEAETITNMVCHVMKPGDQKSTHAVANEATHLGLLPLKKKALQTKIEMIFSQKCSHGDKLFEPVDIVRGDQSEGAKSIRGIKCFAI